MEPGKLEQRPKNGTMQISVGKMSMYINDEWVNFGVAYVASDMRRIARSPKLHRSPYIQKIRQWAGELDRGGMFAIQATQMKLKFFYGASEQWMAQDCRVWHGWLQQIWQFRNCTGRKDAPPQKESNEKYRGNYDTIFKKVS